MLSMDARIALAPEGTYRQLVSDLAQPRWWHVLARPALVLVVLATILPIMATRTITARLFLTSAVAWSAVVLIQIAMALVTVASAPSRRVGFGRACDLWFSGHVPYTAWVLLLPIITMSHETPAILVIAITFVVPTIWTTFVEAAFCRVVLGATPGGARVRVAVHQVVTVGTALMLGLWAAGGTEAVVAYLRRLFGPS